ncbi:thrombomodulin [Ornithorhynchus anatinus]|uniref:Thrombomodulin n=1 Tax=Ornithorhynchus anatinus TaxID=9258 RepID=F6V4R1_ORNAN|nr:thrombomodulin [Ornithorhynchus anatinus]
MLPLWPLWLLAPVRALPQGPAASAQSPAGSQCIGTDCFAVFWTATSFERASLLCERRSGHLMTVRSSVAADVIGLLLEKAPVRTPGSRLWIGLQLADHNCSHDGDGPLRGFRWVTGDSRTSYSKWRDRDDPSCGPLCVAVPVSSAERDLIWETQSCDAVSSGFLCEYNYPNSCQALALAAGARYVTPFGGHGGNFQSLPPDSKAFVSQLGLELTCGVQGRGDGQEQGLRWGRPDPGAWDCSLDQGGCQGTCKRESGGPECECPGETVLLADGRSCGPAGDLCSGKCDQYCMELEGSDGFQCMCDSGFTLGPDGRTCLDIDDCALSPSPCPQACINEKGGFRCECHPGYHLENGQCQQPDCASLNCEYQCLVQPDGLPRCECAPGFAPRPDQPESCALFCNQTQCPADCDPSPEGPCSCPAGYILEEEAEAEGGNVCSDMDECSAGSCDQGCRNLPGSYECFCYEGFRLDPSMDGGCVIDGDGTVEEPGSGEPSPAPPTSTTSPETRPAGRGVPPGALVGIVLGALALAAVLVAVGWRLRRRQCQALGHKGAGPAKEMMLHQMRDHPAPQKLQVLGRAPGVPTV